MTRPIITNIYKRRTAFSDELLSIIADYPDQQIVIIDELLSKLNHIQLDELEDLIVNNYDTEEDDSITNDVVTDDKLSTFHCKRDLDSL